MVRISLALSGFTVNIIAGFEMTHNLSLGIALVSIGTALVILGVKE